MFSFHPLGTMGSHRGIWVLGIEGNLTNSEDSFSRTSSPKNDGGLGCRVELEAEDYKLTIPSFYLPKVGGKEHRDGIPPTPQLPCRCPLKASGRHI